MRPKSIQIVEPTETMKLVEYVNRNGLQTTAKVYGTSASSLSRWLKVQGYEMIRQYRKKAVQA